MKKKLFYLIVLMLFYLNNYSLIEKIAELSYHTSSVSSIIFSPDGKYIITGGLDGKINIIDSKNFKIIETLNNITAVESIDISSNNKYLLSGDRENGVRLWNLKNFELIKYFELPFKQIFALNFSLDNESFIAGGIKGYEIISLKNFNSIKKETIKDYAVRDAIFSYNKNYLVIAIGNKIKIFKLEKNNLILRTIKNTPAYFKFLIELEFQDLIYSIDISKNSQYLAVGGNSTYVTLIRIEDLAHLWSIKSHNLLIWDVKFLPDNNIIITAGQDKILNFIEIKTGKVIYTDRTHPDEIYTVSISPDSNYLATGSKDGKIRIFKLLLKRKVNFHINQYILLIIIIILILILILLKIKRKKSVKDWEI